MEKISRIPISTLTDVNQVSTMIAAAAEVKEQVNSTAQVQIYNSHCVLFGNRFVIYLLIGFFIKVFVEGSLFRRHDRLFGVFLSYIFLVIGIPKDKYFWTSKKR